MITSSQKADPYSRWGRNYSCWDNECRDLSRTQTVKLSETLTQLKLKLKRNKDSPKSIHFILKLKTTMTFACKMSQLSQSIEIKYKLHCQQQLKAKLKYSKILLKLDMRADVNEIYNVSICHKLVPLKHCHNWNLISKNLHHNNSNFLCQAQLFQEKIRLNLSTKPHKNF